MDLEQRLRASLVAPDPGAVFTARVMARVGRGQGRRRTGIILIGTVLAVGAAAAALVWRMTAVEPHSIESVAVPAVPEPEPVAPVPLVQPVPEVKEPVAAAPKAVTPEDNAPRYSVLVMPLRQQSQNAAGRSAVEALYGAVLDELRKVPGLRLQVRGDSEQGRGQADYILAITSLATAVSQSGGVVMRATDGSTRCTENGGPEMFCGDGGENPAGGLKLNRIRGARLDIDYGGDGISRFTTGGSGDPESVVWVEMKVESTQSAAALYTLPMHAEGAPEQQGCKSTVGVLAPDCITPAQLAATQVQTWRLQVFPPDAAFQQQVLAQLGNANQNPVGATMLQDFLLGLVRGDGSRMDAGTIQALVRYMAGQPASTRLSIWMALRRASHPALVAPLVDSLRHDSDRQVRLAALASLTTNFSADPLVRSALEAIEREDADPILRATVRRALYGPAQWRDDVVAALADTALPYEARLAPLIANTTAGSSQQEFEMSRVRQAALREQQILGPLVTLIREHVRESSHAQETANALDLVSSVDDPAVFGLFLQLAQEGALPVPVTGPVGSWVTNHQDDPRVREILPQVVPMVPSELLERMREISGKPGEGSTTFGSGAIITVVPTPQ